MSNMKDYQDENENSDEVPEEETTFATKPTI